jgi:hypothetical protein
MEHIRISTNDDQILLGTDEQPLAALLKMLLAANVVPGDRDEFTLLTTKPAK